MGLAYSSAFDIVSIHAFRGEGDSSPSTFLTPSYTFQSTPSGGKATSQYGDVSFADEFQSTPSGGKATRAGADLDRLLMFQSTPSGGKATGNVEFVAAIVSGFNPRLPGGRRRSGQRNPNETREFQSTPSGGKATRQPAELDTGAVWFQSTPSGGKATWADGGYPGNHGVSIHAFRGEGDDASRWSARCECGFQSTPSGGKATTVGLTLTAPLECFNPRLPGGRRRHE